MSALPQDAKIDALAADLKSMMLRRIADRRTGAESIWFRHQWLMEDKAAWQQVRCFSTMAMESQLAEQPETEEVFLQQARRNVLLLLADNPYHLEARQMPYEAFCRSFVDRRITLDGVLHPETASREFFAYAMAYYWLNLVTWIDHRIGRLNHTQARSLRSVTESPGLTDGSSSYESFADLIVRPADLTSCLNALRQIRPDRPPIDANGRWIASSRDGGKTILVGWVERMEKIGKIHRLKDRRLLVRLLNDFFPGLQLGADGRIFDNPIDESIRLGFIALIPE